MAKKELLFDISTIDFSTIVADINDIRRHNPQRFEMEQLTAIVYENEADMACVGYKDLSHDEFWIRGHMPNMPLMPGVIMIEAAAQLCSYFAQKHNLLDAPMVGFGGLEEVRFRDPVVPGDRLVLICQLTKVRPRRMLVSRFQGVVGDRVVVEGVIKGIPIPVDALSGQENSPRAAEKA